jgi:hypothetical protein
MTTNSCDLEKERNSVRTNNKTEINCHSSREDKIRYMIEVMQADLDGKEIVYSPDKLSWAKGCGKDWDYDGWNLSSNWFPQYRIKPEEPKKKKAVWEVRHRYGTMSGEFYSLESAWMFLKLCGNHKTVERISRVEWDGGPVLDGAGDIIENPYDLLEDF